MQNENDKVFFMSITNMIPRGATVLSLLLGILSCASQRPVLSRNEYLMRVGAEGAERDIDACIARAEATSTERADASKDNVVADTASSSVAGAAAGGAGGAIFGQAGQGAAAGAVGGVVGSLTQALLQGLFRPKPPQPSNQQFVESCLRQKGYEPAGWK
jgi:outer membrane lipoprotein SlyB